MGLLDRFRERLRPRNPAVAHDDRGIRCRWPDGTEQVIGWDELHAVEVETTSGGPWAEDFWLVLRPVGEPMAIPSEAVGFHDLLDRLRALPGFDHDALGDAIRSADDAAFPCWSRPGPGQ